MLKWKLVKFFTQTVTHSIFCIWFSIYSILSANAAHSTFNSNCNSLHFVLKILLIQLASLKMWLTRFKTQIVTDSIKKKILIKFSIHLFAQNVKHSIFHSIFYTPFNKFLTRPFFFIVFFVVVFWYNGGYQLGRLKHQMILVNSQQDLWDFSLRLEFYNYRFLVE